MNNDSEIQFDTDQQNMPQGAYNYATRSAFGSSEASGMAGWLIKRGIISDENQAKFLLVGIVIANFVLAGLVFYFFILK